MKLKCLFLTVAALLFLFNGCNNDAFFGDEPEVVLKKAKVPIPFKGEICRTNNDDVPLMPVEGTPIIGKIPALYVTGESWLSGNCTHMGKLSEESYMVAVSAKLDMSALMQRKIIIDAVYIAHVFAANGDEMECLSNVRMDVTDQSNWILSGDYTVTSGSGRFENAVGSGILSGGAACWEMLGTAEFPRY